MVCLLIFFYFHVHMSTLPLLQCPPFSCMTLFLGRRKLYFLCFLDFGNFCCCRWISNCISFHQEPFLKEINLFFSLMSYHSTSLCVSSVVLVVTAAPALTPPRCLLLTLLLCRMDGGASAVPVVTRVLTHCCVHGGSTTNISVNKCSGHLAPL